MTTKGDRIGLWLRTAVGVLGVALLLGAGWALVKTDIAVNAAQIQDIKVRRSEDVDRLEQRLERIEKKIDDLRDRVGEGK